MARFVPGLICGSAVILALIPGQAFAQHRPAAWDTRLHSAPPPPEAPDNKKAPEPKDQSAKAPAVPGDAKVARPKAN